MSAMRSCLSLGACLPLFSALVSACSSEPIETDPHETGTTTGEGTTSETSSRTTTETRTGPKKLLLWSRTTGFRHDSIPAALDALTKRATGEGWEVVATEDPTYFTDDNLASVSVVAWVMTSGDVLDAAQQEAFERYIHAGGGYFGVHAATDTEYDWPYYKDLVGAYFKAHPAIQPATIRVERPSHAATHLLSDVAPDGLWTRTDEWYAFHENPRSKVIVLLSLDEASYATGGTEMGDHPIAWYHGHDNGRAFYTALGHTTESWSEPAFLEHAWGGVAWAGGEEWEGVLLSEFDGVEPVGAWSRLQPPTDFPFTVDANSMTMKDVTNQNQHVYREGLTLDPEAPYVMEALFTIAPGSDGLNSFCFDLNLDQAKVEANLVSTWAINVDLGPAPGTGVMKHMGFVDGGFAQIGETLIDWGFKGTEYLLRAEVNIDMNGAVAPGVVTATVLDRGVVVERFQVDEATFPYQPPADGLVQVGVNTHGTDWTMRSLRVYALPQP